MEFSETFTMPYSEITNKDHFYVEVDLETFVNNDNQASLVICFEHKSKAYKYRTTDIETQPKGWNKIQMLYLSPEIRDKNDLLKIYIWNRNQNQLLNKNLKIRIYEKK